MSERIKSLESFPSLDRIVQKASLLINSCSTTDVFNMDCSYKMYHLVNERSLTLVEVTERTEKETGYSETNAKQCASHCEIYICKDKCAFSVREYVEHLCPTGIRFVLGIGKKDTNITFANGTFYATSKKQNTEQSVGRLVERYITEFLRERTTTLLSKVKAQLKYQRRSGKN